MVELSPNPKFNRSSADPPLTRKVVSFYVILTFTVETVLFPPALVCPIRVEVSFFNASVIFFSNCALRSLFYACCSASLVKSITPGLVSANGT